MRSCWKDLDSNPSSAVNGAGTSVPSSFVICHPVGVMVVDGLSTSWLLVHQAIGLDELKTQFQVYVYNITYMLKLFSHLQTRENVSAYLLRWWCECW